MGFLYFIETEQFQGTVEDVARAGLSYAFERSPMVRASSQGPGGRAGFVVSGNVDLGFYPAKQSWRRNVKTSKNQNVETWVGKDNGAAIEPWELARSRTLNGHAITLLDGRRWVCPVARRLVDLPDGTLAWTNALPHKWDVDEGGRWITGAVLPRYAALWEEGDWIWEYFKSADGQNTVDGQKAGDAAALALGANYRVGPVECGLLDLIDDQTVFEVLGALVDWPRVVDVLKKKLNSDSGAAT